MPKVRLSEAAGLDLAEIDAYGAERFGDDAADAYQSGIDGLFKRLASFPFLGEEKPDYHAGMRCMVYRRHRILYLVDDDGVLIVRILHHTRDVPRHLPQ